MEGEVRCCVDEADAGDEDVDIASVVGADFTHYVAGCEDEGGEREQTSEFEGLVVAVEGSVCFSIALSFLLPWPSWHGGALTGTYMHCQR